MLYRTVTGDRICITQPTHAWVSGQLAHAWGNEAFGFFRPMKRSAWEQNNMILVGYLGKRLPHSILELDILTVF